MSTISKLGELEAAARAEFESHVTGIVRGFERDAKGNYSDPTTHLAWWAYYAGWLAALRGQALASVGTKRTV